jgi:hypothetical protein
MTNGSPRLHRMRKRILAQVVLQQNPFSGHLDQNSTKRKPRSRDLSSSFIGHVVELAAHDDGHPMRRLDELLPWNWSDPVRLLSTCLGVNSSVVI